MLDAWREKIEAPEDITFLADWNGEVAKSIGMDIDLGAAGLGPRCKRSVACTLFLPLWSPLSSGFLLSPFSASVGLCCSVPLLLVTVTDSSVDSP